MSKPKYNKHESRINNYNKNSLSLNKRYALDNTVLINELGTSEFTTDNIIKQCKLSDEDLDIIKKVCYNLKNVDTFSRHIVDKKMVDSKSLQSVMISLFLYLSLCTYYGRRREKNDPDEFKIDDLEKILIDKIDDYFNHSKLIRVHEKALWLSPSDIHHIVVTHNKSLYTLLNK